MNNDLLIIIIRSHFICIAHTHNYTIMYLLIFYGIVPIFMEDKLISELDSKTKLLTIRYIYFLTMQFYNVRSL